MNRIECTFRELGAKDKSAFIAFITAGYPDLAVTERLILEFSRRGVDIIELGIPFSDPLADGPLIQDASAQALKKGADLRKIFELVRRVRRKTQLPICFMTYYNPVFVMGERRFIEACRSAGVDGVIIPDLTVEEGRDFSLACAKAAIDTVFFASPTISLDRLRTVCAASRGFIYYVSLAGVTGPRQRLPQELESQVRRVKALTAKPVCVGFGVSSEEQVRLLSSFADGVIVGSAIVRRIRDNIGKPGLVNNVGNFVSKLARATVRR
jgi:tryptophan synthase alpha chain